ncbi:MAG: leucyl aminopeptidase [Zetaproteobacteria bacterium]|nr:MAG: leucyl aminopeptidase [Zetaproteobacteria bacterium]
MTLDISFSKAPYKNMEAAVICFYDDQESSPSVGSLNYEFKGFVDHILEKSKSFKGKSGQIEIVMLPEGSPYSYVVLLGCGKRTDFTKIEAEKLGGKLLCALEDKKIETVEFYADNELSDCGVLSAHIAVGLALRSYKFELYQSPKPDDDKVALAVAHFVLFESDVASDLYAVQACVNQGVFLARDLVNEPPNILYPDSYAKRIKEQLKPLGVEIEVLDEKKMRKLGMGAILAVGQGSDNPPRMVIMRWSGDKTSTDAPLAFVGKGVTFDTGGISLKPGLGMEEMKMDMGGSAAVVGLMKSLALRKAKVNVVAVVGLAENMPSARAYRPADIITSYAGKTIEVLNTDAEGRLVLADALSYVQKIYKPSLIIDLATLTGAMLIALGHEYCGTFVTDDALWEQMERAGKASDEKLWRMPLDEVWKKDMEGTISDTQNMAKSGRWAGSCTAAGFLWHFIDKDIPWAHMDIAGTAWIKTDKDIAPKYGTGFGVRVLDRFVAENYEQS